MEKLLVTVEDVKNELDISLASELEMQPNQVNKWIMRQQRTVLNHIARYAYGGMQQVERMLKHEQNVKVVCEAIIEHINYVAENNYVQPNSVMNVSGEQAVEPIIAPLAHQVLLNAGLLYTGAWF